MKLYIGTDQDPDKRFIIDVSQEDFDKTNAPKPFKVQVTDIPTGNTYLIRDADCGLGCRCALDFVTPMPDVLELFFKLLSDKQAVEVQKYLEGCDVLDMIDFICESHHLETGN